MTAENSWRDFFCGYCEENTGWVFTRHLGWLPCDDCNQSGQKARPDDVRAALIEIETLTSESEL